MEIDSFSEIQMAVFSFWETRMKKSNLFKIKDKVNKKEKDLKNSKGDKEELVNLENDLEKQRYESLSTEIPGWLTDCAEKAEKFVAKPMFKNSHPTKFTNGNIPYGGIYVEASIEFPRYLTTETIGDADHDISHSNGNLITHSLFLKLKLDSETVYEKLEKSDFSWLLEFTNDEQKAQSWGKGLKRWTGEKSLKDALGLKQTYFHLCATNYHMVAPLFSSTLCQEIYKKIRAARFDENNKKQKDGMYSEVIYPDIAVMKFGGTHPQNITAGNFVRRGESYLLYCAPPEWHSNLKPPTTTGSIFNGEFDRLAWKSAKELQRYLVRLQNRKSNKKIRKQVKQFVGEIIDILFHYAVGIQNLKGQAGWSESATKLREAHKLWLDPYRKDELFQNQRESEDWQAVVCKDFGLWLNKKLEHKKMTFAKIESSHWAKQLKRPLQEFERDLCVFF